MQAHIFFVVRGCDERIKHDIRNIGAVNSSYSQEESSVFLFDSEYLFSYWLLEDRTVLCRANIVENEIYNAVICIVIYFIPLNGFLKFIIYRDKCNKGIGYF